MAETDEHLPEPEPETPVEQPRRVHTILGRLSQTVRDNWFAVGLEVLIVIAGVVIGFQITAWGNERDLRDREAVSRAASRYEVALDELGGPNFICLSEICLVAFATRPFTRATIRGL